MERHCRCFSSVKHAIARKPGDIILAKEALCERKGSVGVRNILGPPKENILSVVLEKVVVIYLTSSLYN
jgi:hypothetical protein